MNYWLLTFSMLFLTACGGGGGGSSTSIDDNGANLENSVLTINGRPVSGATYTSAGGALNTNGVTSSNGEFEYYDDSSTVSVYIGDVLIGSTSTATVTDPLTVESLIASNNAAASNPTLANLPALLLEDQGSSVSSYALPATLSAGISFISGESIVFAPADLATVYSRSFMFQSSFNAVNLSES